MQDKTPKNLPSKVESLLSSCGNVADIIHLVNIESKGANTSSQAGLDFIRGLRSQTRRVNGEGIKSAKKARDYASQVPRAYL
jgi:hypothetical protein